MTPDCRAINRSFPNASAGCVKDLSAKIKSIPRLTPAHVGKYAKGILRSMPAGILN